MARRTAASTAAQVPTHLGRAEDLRVRVDLGLQVHPAARARAPLRMGVGFTALGGSPCRAGDHGDGGKLRAVLCHCVAIVVGWLWKDKLFTVRHKIDLA